MMTDSTELRCDVRVCERVGFSAELRSALRHGARKNAGDVLPAFRVVL